MNIAAINQSIMQGTWTNEDIESMIGAVKYARSRLAQKAKRAMSVGALVQFTSSRSGRVVQGNVRKIAIKYVTVDTPEGAWRVPANMLEVL